MWTKRQDAQKSLHPCGSVGNIEKHNYPLNKMPWQRSNTQACTNSVLAHESELMCDLFGYKNWFKTVVNINNNAHKRFELAWCRGSHAASRMPEK